MSNTPPCGLSHFDTYLVNMIYDIVYGLNSIITIVHIILGCHVYVYMIYYFKRVVNFYINVFFIMIKLCLNLRLSIKEARPQGV